ncbi:MAG: aminotransferase class I/II-fold pyridoxal phosphate-dependent enzyme [Opitutales bacterium]
MKDRVDQRLREALASREAAGLLRKITARTADDTRVNLGGNDYLDLARDPAVLIAAAEALHTWGASASASALVTGYTELHAKLEHELAAWHGYPHGMLLNSGYAANGAVFGQLLKPGDVVLADRLIHASMVAGILSSGARLRRFAHNDIDALEMLLGEESGRDGAVFVATESVYSMDGDYPDLPRIAALRARHGFVWILDEAHATGWHGESGSGLQEELGCRAAADVVVGTLGKALGSQGAYVLCHNPDILATLVNQAGEFVYSTHLAPPAVAAGLAAVGRAKALAPERPRLHRMSREWRDALCEAGYAVPEGHSPIIPIVIGDPVRTLRLAEAIRAAGFLISAIRPPTVPDGTARLRVSLHRLLTSNHRDGFLAALKGVSS